MNATSLPRIPLPDDLKSSPRARNQNPTLDFIPEQSRTTDPDKIARRTKMVSGGGAQPSSIEFERLMGTNDLVDEFFLERALLSAHPVCRISLRHDDGHEFGCATGFMISPRLLLTNHHVFPSAEAAAPSIAEFNYCFDIAGNPEPSFLFRLQPNLFYFSDPALDFAVVSVAPTASDGVTSLSRFGYHRLIAQSGKALLKEWMNIVQHPGGARRQFAMRENECVKDSDPDCVWYMSDTAQGSSGAAVFNDSFQVVALHHAGVARQNADGLYVLKNKQTVKALDGVLDSEVDWVANAGIRVSRICERLDGVPDQNGHLAEFRVAMLRGDILSNAYQSPERFAPGAPAAAALPPAANLLAGQRRVLGTLVLEISGDSISAAIRPGDAPPAAGSAANSSAATLTGAVAAVAMEALLPAIAPNLSQRTGFEPKFLGVGTPLLKIKNLKSVAAPLKSGGWELKYEHFSVFMHRQRRLAIYTAANVDGSPAAKKPEAGHAYTRTELNGFAKASSEIWALDERLDAQFQLPDKFYNDDRSAFDKGHITRRDDVCWGSSFAQVKRANCDTFHVTNCSPQRGNFNQAGKHGIWGQLEDFVGAQADTEKYCIFAGPILADDDVEFKGVDDSGPVTVKIPGRFWKVVCAIKNKKLQVFPFILEQDTSSLPVEFDVTPEWKSRMVSLKTLESGLKILTFPKVYHTADQGA
jgi:endonuclease G, mitochondrial